MKILYITEVNLFSRSGVLFKLNFQVEYWIKMGHEVHIASFPTLKQDLVDTKPVIPQNVGSYFVYQNKTIQKNFDGAKFNLLNKVFSIANYLDYVNSINPDLIYLRELVAFPGLKKLLKNRHVIIEANTILKNELKHSHWLMRLMNSIFNKQVNLLASGFIGVTEEISSQFREFGKPVTTISNGIDFNANLQATTNERHNNRPQVIMTCSPGCEWHGVDKYLEIAASIPGVDFHLVGINISDLKNKPTSNMVVHGYLQKEELILLYPLMDIAIGSLALYRNEMQEACPLKVREYALFGLPLILGYKDTDLNGISLVLQLPNADFDVISYKAQIEKFIFDNIGNRIEKDELLPLISIEVKEEQRLCFMDKVSNR